MARELSLPTIKITAICHRPELIAWHEIGYANTGRLEPSP
jgi:hypothetical protein